MILPHKHVRFASSLIAIAGFIRSHLHEPRTLDELWALVDKERNFEHIRPTFTQLVLAVDILFAIQQATSDSEGRVILKDVTNADLK